MNEKTKKYLSNAMSAIGIVILSVNLVESIFFNVFDKWTDSLLGVLGVGLILGGGLLRRWKQDSFLLGFGEGIMLVAFLTYIILFFRTEYKSE